MLRIVCNMDWLENPIEHGRLELFGFLLNKLGISEEIDLGVSRLDLPDTSLDTLNDLSSRSWHIHGQRSEHISSLCSGRPVFQLISSKFGPSGEFGHLVFNISEDNRVIRHLLQQVVSNSSGLIYICYDC